MIRIKPNLKTSTKLSTTTRRVTPINNKLSSSFNFRSSSVFSHQQFKFSTNKISPNEIITKSSNIQFRNITHNYNSLLANALYSSIMVPFSTHHPQNRSYSSRAAQRAGSVQTSKSMKPVLHSLADVIDPWIPGVHRISIIQRFKKWGSKFRAINRAKSRLISFRPNKFAREDAVKLYSTINHAFSGRDRSTLKRNCTIASYSKMKPGLQQHQGTQEWKLHRVLNVTPIHAALAEFKDMEKEIFQITVRLISEQSIATYDKRGNLISGGHDKVQKQDEYIVFERNISSNEYPWLYAGKIDPSKPFRMPSTQELLGQLS